MSSGPLIVLLPDKPLEQVADARPGRNIPPYPFDVSEEAGVDRRCLRDVVAAKLLTRNGNPAIQVGIDGVHGAAFLSFTESVLGIYDSQELSIASDGKVAVDSISTEGAADLVTVGDIEIAQGFARNMSGINLGRALYEKVAGRYPLAVLGYDILGHDDLLLDMPRQRMMLFRPSGEPGCPSPSTWIAGAHDAPLTEDENGQNNAIIAHFDGHPVKMMLEPAADTSIIRRADARSAGYTTNDMDPGDPIRTQASGVMLGLRYRFRSVSIGDWHSSNFKANVEPARYNVLGLDFFRHRKVLVRFLDGRMFFGNEHSDLLAMDKTPAEKGPISSRLAIVRVTDTNAAATASPRVTTSR